MKKELIQKLHGRIEDCAHEHDGVEFWLARELQDLLGYTQWRNFETVIDKAKTTCEKAGQAVADHFADVSKMVELGSQAQRPVVDLALTRYACCLTIKAKDFANEITNTQVKQRGLHGEAGITQEHVKNNRDVRKLLTDRDIVPENLPAAEDAKKLEHRLKAEQKKLPRAAVKLGKGAK